MTQPLQQTDLDASPFPLDTIREQILVGERLLENTLRILIDAFGATDGAILDSDLDSGKVLYRTSIEAGNSPSIESSYFLCQCLQNRLSGGETIALSRREGSFSPFLTASLEDESIDALTIVPLRVQHPSIDATESIAIGFLCLYYRDNRPRPFVSPSDSTIQHLTGQCALLLQQARHLSKIEREYREKQQLQADLHGRIQEYLAHITHELRAPLAGILGFARMLQEQIYGTLTDKQHQYIGAIASSGEHLLSLVNDFQDISKIEANFEEIFLERLVVRDICLASLSIVQVKAEEQGLDLQLQIAPEVDFCQADQQRLKQILVNLLSNAIKFTEIGSVTLKVEPKGDRLTFSVIDTGIGIAPEDQGKLFQPFQQIQSSLSKKHKGTGLGLALSRKLARLHGGDISLISEKGKGSCFILEIPRG
ncbi:HAMP domain-containing sensor histidine kinase [Pannus brasiliensis CCIBt3594]|uniref:Circadian input-output histidine kinase CikA n=1 Tax=Pannus brasiliensis CCIBt3594 TaxID=1427578 RepID=A0AAW9QSN0_9CHRO